MTALLLRAARVYPAFPGPLHASGAVLVAGDRVAWTGPSGDVPTGGAVVVPGFIHAHVHLASDPAGTPADSVGAGAATIAKRARASALLLAAGVTTARDLGAPAGLAARVRDEIAGGAEGNGGAAGPRLVASGRPITRPGGHLGFLGGGRASAAYVRAEVRRQRAAGADWVKLVLSGGETTPDSRLRDTELTGRQLCAAVAEAHRAGLPVAAHAHTLWAARAAVRAGVDTIEHCTLLGGGAEHGTGGRAGRRLRRNAGLPRLPGGRTVWVSPTANTRWLAATPDARARRRVRLAALGRAGAELVAGTDAGIPGVFPQRYADGLVALVRHGVTPQATLRAATTGAALALGLDDAGALTPGLFADLVVLDGDPVADITAAARVRAVVKAGILVSGSLPGQPERR